MTNLVSNDARFVLPVFAVLLIVAAHWVVRSAVLPGAAAELPELRAGLRPASESGVAAVRYGRSLFPGWWLRRALVAGFAVIQMTAGAGRYPATLCALETAGGERPRGTEVHCGQTVIVAECADRPIHRGSSAAVRRSDPVPHQRRSPFLRG